MTTKRMLIDASHPEETRVAIVNRNHLEDFDVEVESRKQLRGNIYLAKVTRVEPSLQAAFVDYGGNRHGFLAFSEIHPDYYQIPVADRQALLAEQKAAGTEAETLDSGDDSGTEGSETAGVETLGGDDSEEVEARRPVTLRRRYKIQEVIKRRQILLIQVVKEERGTKGAALTTYLSLAGRYCVLMPNTARGGGISRKINISADRKRLKSILGSLGIPGSMAVIVRTAGQKRSKAEIKRDYDYLMRVWSTVRETTLESMAPCLVHEEGDLIKRSIRDLYDKDISEIIIAGDAGYRIAKDFMKQLIPSHTKRVQQFKEVDKQLFQYYEVESQLAGMHSPQVQLKSGGYIVINPTEALVSIDVNSGRATRGRNIEETALKTNLEASDEIARQLKLRDLAGLIVIDFIDMENTRNQSKVERRLKDVMRSDRARIQIGRISPFGLLELSRQRLRPSLIETSSEPCPHCEGTGIRRSTESAALHLLRAIEDEGMQHRSSEITVAIPTPVALYILNNQRTVLADVESKYQFSVTLETDDTLIPPDFRIERIKGDSRRDAHGKADTAESKRTVEEGGKRRRRRRGRRHGRDEEVIETTGEATVNAGDAKATDEDTTAAEASRENSESTEEKAPGRGKRRRRGRRGGRRRGRGRAGENPPAETAVEPVKAVAGESALGTPENALPMGGPESSPLLVPPAGEDADPIPEPDASDEAAAKKQPKRRQKTKSLATEDEIAKTTAPKPAKRAPTRKPKKTGTAEKEIVLGAEAAESGESAAVETAKPTRKKTPRQPRRKAASPKETTADTKSDVVIPAGESLPVSPSPGPPPPVPAEPAVAASPNHGSGKIEVIKVGAGSSQDQPAGKTPPRKGWWSRASE